MPNRCSKFNCKIEIKIYTRPHSFGMMFALAFTLILCLCKFDRIFVKSSKYTWLLWLPQCSIAEADERTIDMGLMKQSVSLPLRNHVLPFPIRLLIFVCFIPFKYFNSCIWPHIHNLVPSSLTLNCISLATSIPSTKIIGYQQNTGQKCILKPSSFPYCTNGVRIYDFSRKSTPKHFPIKSSPDSLIY